MEVVVKRYLICAGLAFAVSVSPALAQSGQPVGDRDPDAVDVAKTPVTDLNIDKQEIPALLIKAAQRPYDLKGLNRCAPLIDAVEELDALLGPDLDLPQETRDRLNAGRLGKSVVGSFIPFRGLIREVSGANEHERKVRAAVQAGLARRGFLKGIGQSRGCRYPGRPATRANVAEWMAQKQAEAERKAAQTNSRKKTRKAKSTSGTQYTSKPVIQNTD